MTTYFYTKDDTSLKGIQLADFLSHTDTKKEVTKRFCTALLVAYNGSSTICYVACDNQTKCSVDGLVADNMLETNHDEADTLIPLHALDIIKFHPTCLSIDVLSQDTDVFVLLVHVKASAQTDCQLTMLAGTSVSKPKNININKVVETIGVLKSKALLGLHCFTGGDYGGRFYGVTKVRWLARMLEKEDTDPIIRCLASFGLSGIDEQWENDVLEKFVVQVYSYNSFKYPSVAKLRYFLFRTKGSEGDKLPPTKAALLQHNKRARTFATIALSYSDPSPTQPELIGNGWVLINGVRVSHMTELLPAPSEILELVKCGCKTGCVKNTCTCRRHNMVCTDICQCNINELQCQNDEHVYSAIESDEEDN